MRLGLSIWPGTPARAAIRLAAHADKTGFDSVWVPESTALPSRDAITLLGAIAASTDKLKLATGIINVFTRTPLLIASTIAMLDEISNMRTILGLGTGHKFSIEGWHSLKFEKPIIRMIEYIQVIRRLLRGERVDFKGRTISVEKAQLAAKPQRSDVLIYAAGVGEKMIRAVAQIADGLLLTFNPLERLPRIQKWVGIRNGDSHSRKPHIASYIVSFLARDCQNSVNAAKRVVAAYCAAPFYNKMFIEMGFESEAAEISRRWWSGDTADAISQVTEDMARKFVVIGGLEDLIKTIDHYFGAGVDLPIVAPFYFPEDEEHLIQILDAVAEHFRK